MFEINANVDPVQRLGPLAPPNPGSGTTLSWGPGGNMVPFPGSYLWTSTQDRDVILTCWGAGGNHADEPSYGAAGGFSKGNFRLRKGDVVRAVAGSTAMYVENYQFEGGYPGGGPVGYNQPYSGGGYSAFWINQELVLVAGGGGYYRSAGGGLTAETGGAGQTQQQAPFSGWNPMLYGQFLQGAYKQGGGGYYGGNNGDNGGSGFVHPTKAFGGVTTAGTGQTTAGTSDPRYSSSAGNARQHGRCCITY